MLISYKIFPPRIDSYEQNFDIDITLQSVKESIKAIAYHDAQNVIGDAYLENRELDTYKGQVILACAWIAKKKIKDHIEYYLAVLEKGKTDWYDRIKIIKIKNEEWNEEWNVT